MMRPPDSHVDVDVLEQRIEDLQRERQALRARPVLAAAALERNRLALARAQRDLSLALIDLHLHPHAA